MSDIVVLLFKTVLIRKQTDINGTDRNLKRKKRYVMFLIIYYVFAICFVLWQKIIGAPYPAFGKKNINYRSNRENIILKSYSSNEAIKLASGK